MQLSFEFSSISSISRPADCAVDELSRLVVGCRLHRGLQYRGWNRLLLQVDAAIGRVVNFDKLLEQVQGSSAKSLRLREKVSNGDTLKTHDVSNEELLMSRAKIAISGGVAYEQYMFGAVLPSVGRAGLVRLHSTCQASGQTNFPFLAVSIATRNSSQYLA